MQPNYLNQSFFIIKVVMKIKSRLGTAEQSTMNLTEHRNIIENLQCIVNSYNLLD